MQPKRRFTFSVSDRITLIVIHLGLLLLAETLTWQWTHSLAVLQHRGKPATATVIYKGMTTGKGHRSYIIYEYMAGQPTRGWTHSEAVAGDDYDQTAIGSRVPVVFDPLSPSLSHLT